MNSLLISFCNLPSPRSTAAVKLNLDTETISGVKLGRQDITSCTGLCADDTHIYLLFVAGGLHYLGALRKNNLQLVLHHSLAEIKDGHSILVKQSYVYVVSTGTDEVYRYDLGSFGLRNPVVIWHASNLGTDTHHVNSIVNWKGNLVISAFGPSFGSLWASAFDGYIHDISANRCIKTGIYHPHSLAIRGERLYYIESYRKLFWGMEGPISPVDGYSRGVCWLSDDLVCFGKSIGRRFSKSTGVIANPADPGEYVGNYGITLRDIGRGRTMKHINLEWFGPEIYDILVLE